MLDIDTEKDMCYFEFLVAKKWSEGEIGLSIKKGIGMYFIPPIFYLQKLSRRRVSRVNSPEEIDYVDYLYRNIK